MDRFNFTEMLSVAVSNNKVKAKLLVFYYIGIVCNNNPLIAATDFITLQVQHNIFTQCYLYKRYGLAIFPKYEIIFKSNLPHFKLLYHRFCLFFKHE